MWFQHLELSNINLMLFTISVPECIQWLKDMSAVKIRFVKWLYCQHNIPGEGKWHFNGDPPRRISAPCSDIWQWGIEKSLWDDSISVSPSASLRQGYFFCPVTVEQWGEMITELHNYSTIMALVLRGLIDGTFCSYRSSSRVLVHQWLHMDELCDI